MCIIGLVFMCIFCMYVYVQDWYICMFVYLYVYMFVCICTCVGVRAYLYTMRCSLSFTLPSGPK
jgi:hypothetical protein